MLVCSLPTIIYDIFFTDSPIRANWRMNLQNNALANSSLSGCCHITYQQTGVCWYVMQLRYCNNSHNRQLLFVLERTAFQTHSGIDHQNDGYASPNSYRSYNHTYTFDAKV